jgi:hypothetical protein
LPWLTSRGDLLSVFLWKGFRRVDCNVVVVVNSAENWNG